MQYRFGPNGKRAELEYPNKETHPARAFLAWEEGAAKWSVDYLRFSKGEFEYLVFMQRAAFDLNGGGVIVRRNGRKVGQLVCPRVRIKDELYGLGRFGIEAPSIEILHYQRDVSDALEAAGIRE